MYLKDSLPEEECTVNIKAVEIAKGLGISSITVMPMIECESSECCLTEGYRFIAQLMDGKYKKGFGGIPFKVYNVSSKTYETDTFVLW